ncbi:MAG: hypothetical protein ABI571_04225 [Actinomycetota bacterium]
MAIDRESRLDDLYSSPLAEFTRSRNDLAKELSAEALAALRHEAAQMLEESGHNAGSAQLERIVRNLQFAAADATVRKSLLKGRLSSDLEPSGLEAAFGSVGEDAAAANAACKRVEQAENEVAKLTRRIESLD